MLAFVVFSSVAVGAMAIMNQGTATAQRALEITLVRQQIDAQTEALRYMHEKYIAAKSTDGEVSSDWKEIITAKRVSKASTFEITGVECPAMPAQSFILNTRTASLSRSIAPTVADNSQLPYSQVVYNDDGSLKEVVGLWIEAVNGPSPDTIDFNIRACWYAPGTSNPSTLGTIVRLYVPRS